MILLSICPTLEDTLLKGKDLVTKGVILGEEKGSILKFAEKVLLSRVLKETGERIKTPWNDDIIIHFKSKLDIVFIGIAYDSGLDFTIYCGYERMMDEEYVDKIKRLYGKDFEWRKIESKN